MARPVAVAQPELRLRRDDHRACAQGLLQPGAKESSGCRAAVRSCDCTGTRRRRSRPRGHGKSYVLTTGTGSGKSLAYIIPIVDQVLAAKANGTYQPGIKAIIVYPMNALANSQLGELEKFLGIPENQQVTLRAVHRPGVAGEARAIIANPPDILLTNYVMLELVLTRPRERGLVKAAKGLWFLVLDELHTYRGRQGADVALLVRRLRDACDAPGRAVRRHLGHDDDRGRRRRSSGMRSPGSRRPCSASAVDSANVIGETLERHHRPGAITRRRLRAAGHGPRRRPTTTTTSSPTPWPPGSRRSSASSRRPGRPTAAAPQAPPADDPRGRSPARRADRRRRGRRVRPRSRRRCRPGRGSTTRPPAARCSPSGCTSSCPRATTSTSPWSRQPGGTSPAPTRSPPRARARTSRGGADRILVPTAFCRECGQEYLVGHQDRHGRHHRATARARTTTRAAATQPAATCSSATTCPGRRARSRYSPTAGCRTPG